MRQIILIPSLVRREDSERHLGLLSETIASIPKCTNSLIYVVLQGDARHGEVIEGDNRSHVVLYSAEPLGKWGAVCWGIETIRRNRAGSEYVLVMMDADRAFAGEDIAKLAAPILRGVTRHSIGNRDRIGLQTPGVDERLRIFLELYFNTLTLIQLGAPLASENAFDIQCGFQALHSSFVGRLDLGVYPKKYGGELVTFIQSIECGNVPVSVDIRFLLDTSASFGIDTVANGLLSIDLLRRSSGEARMQAFKACPVVYSSRIGNAAEYEILLAPFLKAIEFL
jgi:hypothetical protein